MIQGSDEVIHSISEISMTVATPPVQNHENLKVQPNGEINALFHLKWKKNRAGFSSHLGRSIICL